MTSVLAWAHFSGWPLLEISRASCCNFSTVIDNASSGSSSCSSVSFSVVVDLQKWCLEPYRRTLPRCSWNRSPEKHGVEAKARIRKMLLRCNALPLWKFAFAAASAAVASARERRCAALPDIVQSSATSSTQSCQMHTHDLLHAPEHNRQRTRLSIRPELPALQRVQRQPINRYLQASNSPTPPAAIKR